MPELPEVQALAERLDAFARGRTLTGVDVLQFSALKTVDPPPDALVGRALAAAGRRGKFLLLDFGALRVACHLSQGGRVDVEEPAKRTRGRGYLVRWRFGDRAVLVKEFGTERKAGWWVLGDDDEGPLAALGPEPDAHSFAAYIRTSQDPRHLHTLLRDQRTVAGLGRGYTDDILHLAKLSPFSSLRTIGPAQRENLLAAMKRALEEGLAAERRRRGGLPTAIGDHWRVHNRAGRPCPECGADLRRVSYETHEITYCPPCQTKGRILADRRLSRLVR